MIDIGDGGGLAAALAGPFGSALDSNNRLVSIALPASGWKGAIAPYSQAVAINGISIKSKVDLQSSPELAEKFPRTALIAANDSGNVTVYAIGEKPTQDLTLQATIMEVIV